MTETNRKISGSSLVHGKAKSGSTAQARTLRGQLESGYSALFEQHPIEDHIALLDATPRGKHYHYITPEVAAFWREILDGYGPQGAETYNRVTMLALMDAFQERAAQRNYPESIVDQFRLNFGRIEKKIGEAKFGAYVHTEDLFLKDLAICRLRVFPGGGAWIVDEHIGFSRAPLLTGGVGQFFKFLFLLLFVTRGNAPFYHLHIHLDLLDDFNAEAFAECHARIVEMLERHPEMKGIIGSSWLVDPALEKVSPQHVFIRKQRQDNGGWVFRVGVDIHGGALAKSATRRRLYEEGKYVPTAYLAVWTRNKMIAWARRRARELSVFGTD